jgi:hypothetical protein
MVVHICNLSYLGGRGRRLKVQGWPRQKYQTQSVKQTKSKKTGVMPQIVEYLPSKYEALSLNLYTAQKMNKLL